MHQMLIFTVSIIENMYNCYAVYLKLYQMSPHLTSCGGIFLQKIGMEYQCFEMCLRVNSRSYCDVQVGCIRFMKIQMVSVSLAFLTTRLTTDHHKKVSPSSSSSSSLQS